MGLRSCLIRKKRHKKSWKTDKKNVSLQTDRYNLQHRTMNFNKPFQINLRLATLAIFAFIPNILLAERIQSGVPFDAIHIHAYIVAGVFIATFVLLFYNRLYSYKENELNALRKSQNTRLSIIMHAGKLKLWVYEIETRHYKMLSNTGQFTGEYNPIDFARFYNLDDFEVMRAAVFDICENRQTSATVNMRSNADQNEVRHYTIHLSISKKNDKGHITQILGVQHDITDEYEKKKNNKEMFMCYQTAFNTSLIDFMYFDKEGTLIEINDTACDTYKILDRQQLLNAKPNLLYGDNLFNTFAQKSDYTHTTAVMDIANYPFKNKPRLPTFNGKFYYEYIYKVVRNEEGEVEGTYLAGRGVTELVQSFHQRQEGAKLLRKATKNIEAYIENINYALRASNLLLVNYDPKTFMMEISNTIGETRIKLSQLRCVLTAGEEYRHSVIHALNRMDHYTKQAIELTIETKLRDEQGRLIHLMFSLLPIYDKDGSITHYFGTCKNMTDIIETERLLTIETQKAREAEQIKELFLTNMSYEIRTPLTSVLGFAGLFNTDHDEADEPIFVEEIKKNTDDLLRLINDILYISRLDADMIEFKEEEFDFAVCFDAYCQMGWTNVRPGIMTIIENPFDHLVINGDMELIGRVIENFCALSTMFTFEGHVLAKCTYNRGELIICIEDTGGGIDKETMNKIFQRFVRNDEEQLCGTGLNMPIAYEIIKKMGGSIEMQSERGKGTTVWIFLPCTASHIERKFGITT